MKKYFKILFGIILLALIIILTVYIAPYVYSLKDEEKKTQFIEYVSSLGILGYLILISFNAIQVIIAVLPGEIFEVISGLMYGPWIGFIIVEIGIMVASIIVISIMRMLKLENSKIKRKLENKRLFKLMKDNKRLEVIIFFITIIPCLPKDLLVYIVPFTSIKLRRFLIINAIARIPSIISSTFFGSSLLSGNYIIAISIFTIQALIGIVGLIFNKKIINFIYRKNKDIN